MGKWTDDQLQYLREHSRSQPAAAIAAALGRTEGSVRQKRRSLGLQSYHAGWTKAEEQFLQDQWGVMSIPAIAKRLNRSVEAVIVRKNRLGLGPVLFGGDYISMNQLIIAVCGSNAGGNYKLKSWVENRGLPIHTKRVNQNSFRVIRLNEFWKWAEQHRSFIDFSKMEPLALGEEPAWVAEQRKKDFQAFAIQRKDPWTPDEDARLKMLLQQHRYGYAELSDMLRRSAGAIQRRCNDLGLKERPVKADNHGSSAAWTQTDFDVLADGIRKGNSYTAIGKALGKSEKAVRGKVYFVYLTENQDKVSAQLVRWLLVRPCIRTPAGVCLPSAATITIPLRIAACSSSMATTIRPTRTRTSAPAYLFVCSISLRRFSLTAWWKYCRYRTGSSTAERYLERPRWQTRSEANAKKKRIPV